MQSHIQIEDDELAKRVSRQLMARMRDLGKLRVQADQGTVCLSGPVGSYYLRQVAIASAMGVAGVRHIADEMQVDGHG